VKAIGDLLGAVAGVAKGLRERLPLWNPSDQGYDPRNVEHVPALRLYPEARYVSENRYQIGPRQYVDRLGAFLNPDACPECGSYPGYDMRYFVRLPRTPGRPPWEATFRPCSRCVSAEEIRENEMFVSGTAPQRGGR
jgi:hypothetical protein